MIETVIIDKKVINKDGDERAFYNKILDEIPEQYIQRFAEDNLGMSEQGFCDCVDTDIDEFSDQVIEAECEQRGFVLFKTNCITEQMEVQKLKESLGL
jgi:hypothetical protein